MPKAKHAPTAKALLSRPEWRCLADQVQLELPEAPKPRFQPWRGRGKGVFLESALQGLRVPQGFQKMSPAKPPRSR
jgi:hypothetical protein